MQILDAPRYFPDSAGVPRREQEYLATFPEIDTFRVGSLLGGGRDFSVFRYGVGEVLKIPRAMSSLAPRTAARQQAHLDLMSQYFGEYLAETSLVISNDHSGFVAVQRRIVAPRSLTVQNAKEMQCPLSDIIARNQQLQRDHGVCIDYLGQQGTSTSIRALVNPTVEPLITNILVENTDNGPRLRVVDIGLVEFGSERGPLHDAAFRLFATAIMGVNRALVGKHFGVMV